MELNKKAAIGLVLGTILTVAVTSMVTWLIVTSEAGMDAAEKERIDNIIDERLRLPDNRTYGQAIIELDKADALKSQKLELVGQALSELAEDLDDLE